MIKQYLEHIELVKNLSPRTVENYSHWLSVLSSHISPRPLEKITEKDISSFVITSRKNSLSPKTINLHMIVLRSFLKFCNQRLVPTINPLVVEPIKFSDKRLEIPDKEDLEKLFSMDLPTKSKALIEILFSTGLRVHELRDLQIEYIRFDDNSATIKGKGGKLRLVFFSKEATEALLKYLEGRSSGLIFPDSVRNLQRIVKEVGVAAGLKVKITPHVIRHVFATNLLQNGASIYDAKKLLGHSNIMTTERYLHVSNEHLKDQFNKFHGKK